VVRPCSAAAGSVAVETYPCGLGKHSYENFYLRSIVKISYGSLLWVVCNKYFWVIVPNLVTLHEIVLTSQDWTDIPGEGTMEGKTKAGNCIWTSICDCAMSPPPLELKVCYPGSAVCMLYIMPTHSSWDELWSALGLRNISSLF